METWKDVLGFENYYEVSNTGLVRSKPRLVIRKNGRPHTVKSKILKPCISTDGYLKSCFSINGKLYPFAVHRVAANSFLGKQDGYEVNHINGIKTDNRIENLELLTHSENIKHAVKLGLLPVTRGSQRTQAKTTESVIKLMQEMRAKGIQRKVILSELNLSLHTYKDVIRGKSWRHV